MKSIKSKILVFLSFLFSIFFVGSAFSAYIFSERTNLHTDKANGLMDDIDINYDLDANAYTVYFFPSSKWANYISDYMDKNSMTLAQTIEKGFSVDQYKSYIQSIVNEDDKKNSTISNPTGDDLIKIFGYFPDDEDPFNYKVRYADTCISTDTFDQMPVPETYGRDKELYFIRFSGWTANFENAIEFGYNSQGTYDYISSYDELSSVVNKQSVYDKKSKTLLVFPVLTAGKEYNDKKPYNCYSEHAVRIHNRVAKRVNNDMYFDRELYFSQEGNGNSAYYFYNNLRVKENEMLYLDFAFGGDWFNFKNVGEMGSLGSINNSQNTKTDETWGGDSQTYTLNPLFNTTGKGKSNLGDCAVNQPGVYNIYAYICESGNENTVPAAFKNKNLTNSSLVWYEDTEDKSHSTTVVYKEHWYSPRLIYNIYVKIEKILEFGLSGGRTKSLQYVDALQMNSSSLIKPDDNQTTTNTSSRYYILNNVFLEGKDIDETITFNNKLDGNFYSYPSSMSTILTNDDTPVEFGELKATQQQLEKFQTDYNAVYGENSIYKFTDIYNPSSPHYSKYSVVKDDGITTLFGNSKKDIFIQPEKSGFYSIVAKMTMTREAITDTNLTSDLTHPYRLKFEKCQIALCLGHEIGASVYLYEQGVTINRKDKFINTSNDANANWYAMTKVPYGTEMTYNTVFKLKDGSTKKLSEILGVTGTTASKHLTNHLTGREFKFNDKGESIQLRRNYAFYIMPGAWQEGELTK